MSSSRSAPAFFTIGAYGFSAETFLAALREAGIDTFCDLRARRGLRGSEYAFANATRLQDSLQEMGIRYLHFPELAPSKELRAVQAEQDHATRTAKRKRGVLSPAFVAAYRESHLAGFDSAAFLEALPDDARHVALFCVEREPGACHRSLLADRLASDLGTRIQHLLP